MHEAVVQVAHMFQVMKMEETPLVDSRPSEAMWSAIVSSLVFSRDQQASLMQHRRHFYGTLGSLLHDHTAAQDLWVWQIHLCMYVCDVYMYVCVYACMHACNVFMYILIFSPPSHPRLTSACKGQYHARPQDYLIPSCQARLPPPPP